jgi:hypothetical protein
MLTFLLERIHLKGMGIPHTWVKVDGNARTSGYITCHLSGADVVRGALNAIF